MNVDVYIWGWSWQYESVGHVMLVDAEKTNAILSQFPQPSRARGKNTFFDYLRTTTSNDGESKRLPSIIFRVTINNEAAFNTMVENHRQRLWWDWDPMPPSQTHCARSSYDALIEGGVNIDPLGKYTIKDHTRNQIIPDTLWHLLKTAQEENQMQGIKIVWLTDDKSLPQECLPEDERLEYEADIAQYAPGNAWYKAA